MTRRAASAAPPELERRLLTHVIGATRAPEDTDVGQFVRALFRTTPPPTRTPNRRLPSADLAAPVEPPPKRAPPQLRMDPAGLLLQQTAPSARKPPAEDEAFAATRTPTARRFSAATAPGQESAVTSAPGSDDSRALALRFGAGRRRLSLAALGLAVLLGVGAVAFVAGQREPLRVGPASPLLPATSLSTLRHARYAPSPPPPPRPPTSRSSRAARASSTWPPSPRGSSTWTGTSWRTSVPRRVPLAPGTRTVRLVNGKKIKTWTVDIEGGKTRASEDTASSG